MPRAEPCPVPECTAFKMHGHPFCRDHWRMLPTFWRAILVKALSTIADAARFGDEPRFRGATAHYHRCRDRAVEIISNKEAQGQ